MIEYAIMIIVPIGIAFGTWAGKAISNARKCSVKTDARTLRQSKALIVLANRIDDINKEQHGKQLNLGPEIEVILKDKDGNL